VSTSFSEKERGYCFMAVDVTSWRAHMPCSYEYDEVLVLDTNISIYYYGMVLWLWGVERAVE
jgi:hypothetical protein